MKRFAIVLALRKVTYADHRSGTGGLQLSLELPWPGRLYGRTFAVALWTWKVPPPAFDPDIFAEADARRAALLAQGKALRNAELLAEEEE